MKRLVQITQCIIYAIAVFTFTNVYAQEDAPLGNIAIGINFGYNDFTDTPSSDDEKDGICASLNIYKKITNEFPLYLGFEYASASSGALFGSTNIDLIGFGVNLKYVKELSPKFIVDFGAGAFYSEAEYDVSNLFGPDIHESDWIYGGQIFGDFFWKFSRFVLGVQGQYQITEELKDLGFDFTNYRISGHFGVLFF